MNNEPVSAAKISVPDDSTHLLAIGIPLVGILMLFILGALHGGDTANREILILARFLSLLILAMSVFTVIVVGLNYKKLRWRWASGQLSAGFMAVSSGYLWSASAFGAGFLTLMVGVTLITLLLLKESGTRRQRRQIGKQIKDRRLS